MFWSRLSRLTAMAAAGRFDCLSFTMVRRAPMPPSFDVSRSRVSLVSSPPNAAASGRSTGIYDMLIGSMCGDPPTAPPPGTVRALSRLSGARAPQNLNDRAPRRRMNSRGLANIRHGIPVAVSLHEKERSGPRANRARGCMKEGRSEGGGFRHRAGRVVGERPIATVDRRQVITEQRARREQKKERL